MWFGVWPLFAHGFTKSGVAVEKLHFRQNGEKLGDTRSQENQESRL
jgi:hypothetical protein